MRRVGAFQCGRDEVTTEQFVVRLLAGFAAGAFQPFEDAPDKFYQPGAVKDFVRCNGVFQRRRLFLLKGRFVNAGEAFGRMPLLRQRRAPGVGVEMPERFQQQIAEAALARIGCGKQIVAQAMGEEVLHEVLAVFLRATDAAEVAINRLPVAVDEEVENRPLLRAHARAQGEVFAPLGRWHGGSISGGFRFVAMLCFGPGAHLDLSCDSKYSTNSRRTCSSRLRKTKGYEFGCGTCCVDVGGEKSSRNVVVVDLAISTTATTFSLPTGD